MILPYDTWGQVLFVFILSVVRYLVIGGLAFLFFYVLLKNKLLPRDILFFAHLPHFFGNTACIKQLIH